MDLPAGILADIRATRTALLQGVDGEERTLTLADDAERGVLLFRLQRAVDANAQDRVLIVSPWLH